jgi:hypothetical protein
MDHSIRQLSELNQLPDGTSSITFEFIDLSNTTAEEFEQSLGTLPPSINGLYFESCELGKNPNFASIAKHLPASVKCLLFTNNELFEHQSTEVLQEFMKSLRIDFEELCFQFEPIPEARYEEDIPSIFAKLPAYLGKLSLIEVFPTNDSFNLDDEDDAEILSTDKIIKALTNINSNNGNFELQVSSLFKGRTAAEITLITQTLLTISNKIHFADSENDITIDTIFSALRGTEIEQVTFDRNTLSVEQNAELQTILQNNQRRGTSLMSSLLRASIWADKPEAPKDDTAECNNNPNPAS